MPLGDTITFLFRAEDRGLSPEGEPMFLQATHRGPHPRSDQVRGPLRLAENRRELNAREFLELMHRLPSIAALEEDRTAAVAAFEKWVVENSDSTAYPVAESLRMLRRLRPPAAASVPTGHELVGSMRRTCLKEGRGC